ncbi:MAG: hypothetical protein ACNI23_07690 [Maridesulfovibrio sp.]
MFKNCFGIFTPYGEGAETVKLLLRERDGRVDVAAVLAEEFKQKLEAAMHESEQRL